MDPHSNVESKMKLKADHLKGRVAIITGGSRGIGRECALALARLGCNIVIAAKTITPHPTLPGTIYTVAEEVRAIGVEALPYQVDLRDAAKIEACVEAVVKKFGRVDILVNNASALWWQDIVDTPARKYDLITSINARGTFLMTRACLPHMEKNNFGRVVTMSPPIQSGVGAFQGRTAYNISKMGMVSFVCIPLDAFVALLAFLFLNLCLTDLYIDNICFANFLSTKLKFLPDNGRNGCSSRI
jgi:NAD(P)-dependent dehydrogenase (short-subunit alcohol dehydrogenase family)